MRTTLWSRLKPEFKKGLEEGRPRWDFAIDTIEKNLSEELFYTDLTINSIGRVWLYSDVKGGYDRDITSWKFGEDMFDLENGCA